MLPIWCFFLTKMGSTRMQHGKSAVLCNVLLRNLGFWLLWHIPLIQTLQTTFTPSWQQYSLMPVASFSRIMCHATMFKNVLRNMTEFSMLILPPNSKDLGLIEHLLDVLEQEVWPIEVPPHHYQEFNALLLRSWCNIPQHNFRGLLESKTQQQVRAILAAQGQPTRLMVLLIDVVHKEKEPLMCTLKVFVRLIDIGRASGWLSKPASFKDSVTQMLYLFPI